MIYIFTQKITMSYKLKKIATKLAMPEVTKIMKLATKEPMLKH